MKFKLSLATLAAAASLAIAAPASAGPELTIPDFDQLRQKAVDSTDLTVDGFLMRIAQRFAESEANDDDPQARQAREVLKGIKSVRVRNFQFDSDDAYSKADIDSVRKQLTAPGWNALVQVHKRDPREDVDVYVCMEGGKATGLAVIASEPREFTIVNIIGSIDIDKFASLEGQFGIPRVSQN
ncbi:MAG TPA: DUF4252 domain-containing protein [Steroidobacteraceae bacterium]|nr:DUF4252 domain-containing protein [Steroidobacteraceae bacterium]